MIKAGFIHSLELVYHVVVCYGVAGIEVNEAHYFGVANGILIVHFMNRKITSHHVHLLEKRFELAYLSQQDLIVCNILLMLGFDCRAEHAQVYDIFYLIGPGLHRKSYLVLLGAIF